MLLSITIWKSLDMRRRNLLDLLNLLNFDTHSIKDVSICSMDNRLYYFSEYFMTYLIPPLHVVFHRG